MKLLRIVLLVVLGFVDCFAAAQIHKTPSGAGLDGEIDIGTWPCVESDEGSPEQSQDKSLFDIVTDNSFSSEKREELFLKAGQALADFHWRSAVEGDRDESGRFIAMRAQLYGHTNLRHVFYDASGDGVLFEDVASSSLVASVNQKHTISNDLIVFVFTPYFYWLPKNMIILLPDFEKCMCAFLLGYVQSYCQKDRHSVAKYVKAVISMVIDVAIMQKLLMKADRKESIKQNYFAKRPGMHHQYFKQENALWTAFLDLNDLAGVIERLRALRTIIEANLRF